MAMFKRMMAQIVVGEDSQLAVTSCQLAVTSHQSPPTGN